MFRFGGQVFDLAPSLLRGALCGVLSALFVSLSGCAYLDFEGRRDALLEQAGAESWDAAQTTAPPFTLFTLSRTIERDASLTVYIEGDGRAWLDRTTPSADPTPARPVALRLALADPAPNILYVARPCQYIEISARIGCDARYWTSHRFAPEVVNAISAAIDLAKRQSKHDFVELIGYSGGGAMAALLAARRSDVRSLITVAANLDLAAWTQELNVDPLVGSLDPAPEAGRIAQIPQYHLTGGDDEIVRSKIVRRYVQRVAPPIGIPRIVEDIPGYSHDCCWHLDWAEKIAAIRRRLERAEGNP